MFLPVFVLSALSCAASHFCAAAAVQIAQGPSRVPAYGKFEAIIDTDARHKNPYDYDDISIQGVFTAPSGRTIIADAFYFQDFLRRPGPPDAPEGREILVPAGQAHWRVRFTPRETGTYRYRITIRNSDGGYTSPEYNFSAEAAVPAPHGFIRRSATSPHHFEYESGAAYFPVGQNLCWSRNLPESVTGHHFPSNGTYDFENWLSKMALHEANFARVWLGPFNELTLERRQEPGRSDTGLRRYDQEAAWRMDFILAQSASYGMSLMLTLESFNSLRRTLLPHVWRRNPYTAANGGMLRHPWRFFTDKKAKSAFKNRLRYIIARYGWSPSVFAWELINEADLVEGFWRPSVSRWHREMSAFIKRTDPYGHLVSSSYSYLEEYFPFAPPGGIDFVQTHAYGGRDMAAKIVRLGRRKAGGMKKKQSIMPHVVSEFGVSLRDNSPDTNADAHGLHIHNALWSSVFTLGGGAAMTWWWYNYIDPMDLYFHFAPVSKFTRTVEWNRYRWKAARLHASHGRIRALGMTGEPGMPGSRPDGRQIALVWLQNKDHTWHRTAKLRKYPRPVKNAVISLRGLRDGTYEARWIDTWSGETLKTTSAVCKGGLVRLKVDRLSNDVAVAIKSRI